MTVKINRPTNNDALFIGLANGNVCIARDYLTTWIFAYAPYIDSFIVHCEVNGHCQFDREYTSFADIWSFMSDEGGLKDFKWEFVKQYSITHGSENRSDIRDRRR